MVTVEGNVVGGSVVSGEHEEVAVTAEATIQIAEEGSQVLVQTQVGIFRLHGEGAVAMAYVVGSRMAHREEVRFVRTCPEALAFDSGLSHLEGQRIAEGGSADDTRSLDLSELSGIQRKGSGELAVLIPRLFVGYCVGGTFTVGIDGIERIPAVLEELSDTPTGVELLDPFGQILHVVGAGDEASGLVIKPVSAVGSVTSREDGGTVLDGDTDGFRAEVRSDAQLIGDGRRQEVARGHLSAEAVGSSHGADGGILRAVDGVAVLEEVIPCNTVEGGDATGVDGAVPDGGVGREVVDARVLAVEALRKQSLEAAFYEASLIAVKVVPGHLVDHHRDHQSGAIVLRSSLRRYGRGERHRS